MTEKEKALELCNKFIRTYKTHLDPPFVTAREEAKENALIAVDEILDLLPEIAFGNRVYDFWLEVKQEIQKL